MDIEESNNLQNLGGSESSDIENPFDDDKQIADKSVSFAPLPTIAPPILHKEMRKDIAYPNKHEKVQSP